MQNDFQKRLQFLKQQQHLLFIKANEPIAETNGIYVRYKNPVLTAGHAPLSWRYDFNEATNPFLMERFGINATLNAGAIKFEGKYLLVVRVEGLDRKSFLQWLKAAMALTISGFGITRFLCRKQKYLIPIFMICV